MGLLFLFPPALGELKAQARAELLTEQLTKQLEQPVSVEVTGSYRELERAIVEATADLAWAPPVVCAASADHAAAILAAVREDGTRYCAAILTRADGPRSLAELRDARAAWVAPESSAGYLLPRHFLAERGLPADQLFSAQAFVGSYRDAAMRVIGGHADVCSIYAASATEGAARATLVDLVGGLAARLQAIAYTAPSPSDAIVITRRPTSQMRGALTRVLTGKECSGVLLQICNARGFVVGNRGQYAALRRSG